MAKPVHETKRKLEDLETRALQGDPKAVHKQHEEGKWTARERIAKLVDPGSFVEEFMLAETQCTDFGMAEKREPTHGVVIGYGKVEGRSVYIFAQDRTVLAGTVGRMHGEKIIYAIENARKLGVPLVGLYESLGARVQEG